MKKPKEGRRRPAKIQVHLSRRVLDLIEAECLASEGETGGILVGHLRRTEGSLAYEVTHATPPGPDSSSGPRRFVRGSVFARRRLDYLADRFGVQYLGEWHKHPVRGTPRASNTDCDTIRAIARKPTYDIQVPILAIANRKGRRLTIYASDCRTVALVYASLKEASTDGTAS